MYLDQFAEIGRAVKTHTAVEAALIATGSAGPWEYYLMLAGNDPRQAARLQVRAMLNEAIANVRR